ncbi:ABC transporter ATP-binding protein [Planctomycetes bacterium K23_9]|uniref:Putative ABC transporter ATP-binding protein YbhF n=1 Tax=Stieleria marina TaxID=1930275 RepID=A0A517NMR1_9BACT|nr:putative ABC transporter ATP-binding protein YbhF [Planctomycetes bacterium K23_9]
MKAPAIELKRLTRYFGSRPVVRDLDFCVPEGKVTALLGLNGAGKTTTIRILMGLLSPTRGAAMTLGQDATKMSTSTRARIGYLVEGHFLYPSMRVRQCESFQRVGYSQWDDSMFREIVDHFGIDPDAKVSTLSRGQRAGVSLGLVLAPDPELLVLDDPALGLDPVSRRALNETLIEFAGGGRRTVLLSTHLLDDVERIADRVAVMVGGRLKVDASLESFRDRVTFFTVPAGATSDASDAKPFAAVPGLIEARRLGGAWQLAVADADQETMASLSRVAGDAVTRNDTTFSDAVLAYLTRERGDGSFLVSGRQASGSVSTS